LRAEDVAILQILEMGFQIVHHLQAGILHEIPHFLRRVFAIVTTISPVPRHENPEAIGGESVERPRDALQGDEIRGRDQKGTALAQDALRFLENEARIDGKMLKNFHGDDEVKLSIGEWQTCSFNVESIHVDINIRRSPLLTFYLVSPVQACRTFLNHRDIGVWKGLFEKGCEDVGH
jgi:hypothetical protein